MPYNYWSLAYPQLHASNPQNPGSVSPPTPVFQYPDQTPSSLSSMFIVYHKPPQVATKETVLVPQSSPKLNIQCKGEGLMEHPHDCSKFIRCKLNLARKVFTYEERSCADGLSWDKDLETCNFSRYTGCTSVHKASPSSSIDIKPDHHHQSPSKHQLHYISTSNPLFGQGSGSVFQPTPAFAGSPMGGHFNQYFPGSIFAGHVKPHISSVKPVEHVDSTSDSFDDYHMHVSFSNSHSL